MTYKRSIAAALLAGSLFAGAAQAADLVIAGRDCVYGNAQEATVEAYRDAHPDTEIELLKLPYGSLYEKTVVSLREASGAYDLIFMDDTWATEFMGNGWLQPLPASVADDDFIDATMAISRHPVGEGSLYALPVVGNVEMFAYRSDLLAAYGNGRPQSWSEVLESARAIERNEPGVHGVVFRGTKGNPIVTGFLPILWAHGGRIVDDAGAAAIDSAAAREALTLFKALRGVAPEGVEVYNSTEVRDALQQGKAAMAFEVWPSWVPSLDDPAVSEVVGDMEIVAAPGETDGSSPMLGIWQMAVPADAPHPETAREFLAFLTSAANQKRLALDIGLPPTRASVYMDDEVTARYRWYPNQLEALRNGQARPRITRWNEVESILGDYLQLALLERMPVDEALAQANARIADALNR